MKIQLIARRYSSIFFGIFLATCNLSSSADTQTVVRPGFTPHIGAELTRGIELIDADGSRATVEQLVQNRPAILLFNYYRCANVCGVMIEKTFSALHRAKLTLGKDIDVLIVSIDPREKNDIAAAKKHAFMQRYGAHFIEATHFLTSDASALSQLQRSAGFNARFDAEQNQYIHPTGLIFLTPQARIASYEMGLPEATALKKNIAAAQHDDTGSLTDSIASICQHLAPLGNQRSVWILHSLRNSVVAISSLGLVAVIMRRKRRGVS